jgi:hypothetical protein
MEAQEELELLLEDIKLQEMEESMVFMVSRNV